jgi:hypothetical protein
MPNAQELLYRFKGTPDADYSVVDVDGNVAIPRTNDTIKVQGEFWKVANVDVAYRGEIAAYTIYLTDLDPENDDSKESDDVG